MKKLILYFLILSMLAMIPFSVSALDVYDSNGDYYRHGEDGAIIPYRLILPDVYDERYIFPMVVFFHGAGERGVDNEKQLLNCIQQIADNMPKAIILVPQCSPDNRWVDTPWEDGCYSMDAVPESDEMAAVMALVEDIMAQYSVDKDRVYATGISMGAFGVWDAMVRYNHVFAAGVAVCGAGDPAKAELLRETPMFVFHGDADDTVPVSGSADMVAAIEAAGGTQVQYTEYAGAGHGIWTQVFNLEKLYKDLQKCELSDRYSVQEPVAKEPDWVQLLPGVAAIALILTTVLLCAVKVKKRKKKVENKE